MKRPALRLAAALVMAITVASCSAAAESSSTTAAPSPAAQPTTTTKISAAPSPTTDAGTASAATTADPSGNVAASEPATVASTTVGTAFPVTVDNCGRPLTFTAPPQRIVSTWPTITEMLIALGVGSRIAGQAYTDQSPPLPQYAAQYNQVKVLSTNAMSREKLLAARPDLIVADGEYHFDGKELPSIADLNKLGIAVYIISSFCHGAVTTGKVADVTTDLTALGALLGQPAAAAALQSAVTGKLATVKAAVAGKPATELLLCQVFDKAIYAEAEGIYSDVVTLAGGRNIYDGQLPAQQYYAQVSIEDIAKKNPSTIVYLSNSAADQASTEKYLTATFPTVDAVKNNRLIPLPSVDFINLRAVDGVVDLHAALNR